MHIKGSRFVAGLLVVAASVAGCGSSKHSTASTASRTTTGVGTSTTTAFARAAAPVGAGSTFNTLGLSQSERLVQLDTGACQFEIVGRQSATITGASVTWNGSDVPVRVISILVSPRYASAEIASSSGYVSFGGYDSAPSHMKFYVVKRSRVVKGAELRPGFYNLIVEAVASIGSAQNVNLRSLTAHLRSGTDQATFSCPLNFTMKRQN